jgi:hypothetical protein
MSFNRLDRAAAQPPRERQHGGGDPDFYLPKDVGSVALVGLYLAPRGSPQADRRRETMIMRFG